MANISFAPSDFVQGGLLSDVDVEIVESTFVAWDYNGSLPNPDVLALRWGMKVLGSEDELHEQYFSAGNVSNFCPNLADNGDTIIPQSGKEKLTTNSNFWVLVNSLKDAGCPENVLRTGQASAFVGLKCHVERVPAPKRVGMQQRERDDKRGPETVMVVTKIISAPWDKQGAKAGQAKGKGAAAAPAGAGKGKQAAAPAETADGVDEDVANKAIELFAELLGDGPVAVKKLKVQLMTKLSKEPAAIRTGVTALLSDEGWLTENGFQLEDGEISVA